MISENLRDLRDSMKLVVDKMMYITCPRSRLTLKGARAQGSPFRPARRSPSVGGEAEGEREPAKRISQPSIQLNQDWLDGICRSFCVNLRVPAEAPRVGRSFVVNVFGPDLESSYE